MGMIKEKGEQSFPFSERVYFFIIAFSLLQYLLVLLWQQQVYYRRMLA